MAMIVILCVSVVCRQVILFERRGFGPWARLLAVKQALHTGAGCAMGKWKKR
jgi:hypothetical protein